MRRIAPSRRPLVGRDDELCLLGRWLDRPEEQTAVAIVGETGIGKTRLLAAAVDLAAVRRYAVVAARASELEREVPFNALRDALEGDVAGDGPLLTPDAVRAALSELGTRSVLAIDDLHWADAATLELLAELLASPSNPAIRLVLAYRPAQAPAGWLRTVEAARGAGRMRMIAPAPLSLTDTRRVLHGELVGDAISTIHRDGGGVPLFLEQLARARETGDIPSAVADAVASELAPLSPTARRLADAAAVAGDPFTAALAARIAGMSAADVAANVAELRRRELVRAAGPPDLLAFRHPIVRDAVYAATPPSWRVGAHARAAAALADAGASPVAQAPHVERSARIGDAPAIAVLTAAGRTEAAHAPATAARWFEAALRLGPSAGHRADVQLALAHCLTAIDRIEDASRIVDEVLATPAVDARVRPRAVVLGAQLSDATGRRDEARRRLEATLRDLSARADPDAVAVTLELLRVHHAANQPAAMRTVAAEAVDLAERCGSAAQRIAAHAGLSTAQALTGDVSDARRHVAAAAALLDAGEDAAVAQDLSGLVETAMAEFTVDQLDAAARHLRRGAQLLGEDRHGIAVVPLLTALVSTLTVRGELDEAFRHARELLAHARASGSEQTLWRVQTSVCWTHLQRGDVLTALTLAEEASRIAEELDHGPAAWVAHCTAGAVQIAAGDFERGRHHLRQADLAAVPDGLQPRWRAVAALAEIGLGRLDAAEEQVRHAEAIASTLGLASRTADAQRARAAMLLASGKHGPAVAKARSASRQFARVGMRLDAIEATLIGARALAAAGHDERARTALRRAHTGADRLGALRLRDETAHALRRVGGRVARRPVGERAAGRGAVDLLTKREREIADLIVADRTNKEIAATLFLSEKTVEKHVSNVLGKLGARSRVQVAAAVSEAVRGERG